MCRQLTPGSRNTGQELGTIACPVFYPASPEEFSGVEGRNFKPASKWMVYEILGAVPALKLGPIGKLSKGIQESPGRWQLFQVTSRPRRRLKNIYSSLVQLISEHLGRTIHVRKNLPHFRAPVDSSYQYFPLSS